MKKTEFIDCPECGAGVSMITNPSTCYKCKAQVFSKHDELYGPPDMVNAPPHYTHMDPQPLELCVQLPFLEGNIVKYVCRFRHKGGLEDLHKARRLLDTLIAKEYPGENA